VVAQEPGDFKQWASEQQKAAAGNAVFQSLSCVSCHAVKGTTAAGKFGPDLTHLMSRQTLAAGAITNTPENLREWVKNPQGAKPGSLMPSLQLTDEELGQVVSYLQTLK
jgi:cytochrome c oxidase subunit II